MWRLLVAVALLWGGSDGQDCKDDNGGTVAWYILYKLPNDYKYIYIDASGHYLGTKTINDKDSALGRTLEPILKQAPDFDFVAYNDQPPDAKKKKGPKKGQKKTPNLSPKVKFGHSKGVVMVEKNVLWLLHSTPQFPFKREAGSFYPQSGFCNGQTFICVTFDKTDINTINTHLQRIRARIFDHNGMSDTLNQVNNFWQTDIVMKTLNELKHFNQDFKVGNQEFKAFSKKISIEKKVDGDLYANIAKELNINVFAQTWAGNKELPHCPDGQGKVYKVTNMIYKVKNTGEERQWNRGTDHSKWCVSDTDDWTCIGDSNRQASQYERPGGALCIKNSGVTKFFRDLVQESEKCPAKSRKKRNHEEEEDDNDEEEENDDEEEGCQENKAESNAGLR